MIAIKVKGQRSRINIKMVPYIKENKLIIDFSLDMRILFSDIATVDHSYCIHHVCCLPAYASHQ